jgi:hypothetical protein
VRALKPPPTKGHRVLRLTQAECSALVTTLEKWLSNPDNRTTSWIRWNRLVHVLAEVRTASLGRE